jgi:hypothetical protein
MGGYTDLFAILLRIYTGEFSHRLDCLELINPK